MTNRVKLSCEPDPSCAPAGASWSQLGASHHPHHIPRFRLTLFRGSSIKSHRWTSTIMNKHFLHSWNCRFGPKSSPLLEFNLILMWLEICPLNNVLPIKASLHRLVTCPPASIFTLNTHNSISSYLHIVELFVSISLAPADWGSDT